MLDVGGGFDAAGEADKIVSDAEGMALCGREAAVGGLRGVEGERVDVTHRRGREDEPQSVHETPHGTNVGGSDLEGEHASAAHAAEESLSEGVLGMTVEAGIVDA